MNQIKPKLFFDNLIKGGINFFSGVPDSLLKDFCFYIDDNLDSKHHIIAANEGSALALGIGNYLATGNLSLVYLQNSGFGNLVNPLLSLADKKVYSIPGILMIGWRGEPGVPDEPQHFRQGEITLELLEIMNIPYKIFHSDMDENEVIDNLNYCLEKSQSKKQICALVIKKGFFENYSSTQKESNKFELSRSEAIEIIIANSQKDDVVVATTGLTSRELYELRKSTNQKDIQDFLVVGGMGHANQIALGIAINQPDKRVICLDGDGSIIMHMGSLTTVGSSKQKNFLHVVLNNGAHDSVGGQKTTALDINLAKIAEHSGYKNLFSVSQKKEIVEVISKINQLDGPTLLEIKINKGWDKDIGRPSSSPEENKNKFMLNLSKQEDTK